MTHDIFQVDEYQPSPYTKVYLKRNTMLLAWPKKDLILNGVKYKETIGIKIQKEGKYIDIGKPGEKEIKIKIKSPITQVHAYKNSTTIVVDIEYDSV